MDKEWMPFAEAADMLRLKFATDAEAVEVLRSRLATKLMHACAGDVVKSVRANFMGEYGEVSAVRSNRRIPACFWNKANLQRWRESAFSLVDLAKLDLSGRAASYNRYDLRNVTLRVDGLMRLEKSFPDLAEANVVVEPKSEPSEVAAKSKRGRKPSPYWADFSVALAMYVHNEGIPAPGNSSQEAVIAAVLAIMSENGCADLPDRSTVLPVIKDLLERLNVRK